MLVDWNNEVTTFGGRTLSVDWPPLRDQPIKCGKLQKREGSLKCYEGERADIRKLGWAGLGSARDMLRQKNQVPYQFLQWGSIFSRGKRDAVPWKRTVKSCKRTRRNDIRCWRPLLFELLLTYSFKAAVLTRICLYTVIFRVAFSIF